MVTDTRDRIISYISYHGQARVDDLVKMLGISSVAVHKQLNKLLRAGLLKREGKPPIVFYTFPSKEKLRSIETEKISEYTQRIIAENFLSITPDGKLLYGIEGFNYWVAQYGNKKSYGAYAQEYNDIIKKQSKHFTKGGWLDATQKLKETFSEQYIEHLLFLDFYSYPVFRRTKLAKLVMYAKQTGNRRLIDQVSSIAKPIIRNIIKTYLIDAVIFIPPTVPRPLQFMDEFAAQLALNLPEVEVVKVIPGDIPIPQKTLSSLEERIINARNSMYVKEAEISYKNVLLIDDVVGSGASFHEVAKKLKVIKGRVNQINAFSLVGNVKGYDVIREI